VTVYSVASIAACRVSVKRFGGALMSFTRRAVDAGCRTDREAHGELCVGAVRILGSVVTFVMRHCG
jgi:hypothetical protein